MRSAEEGAVLQGFLFKSFPSYLRVFVSRQEEIKNTLSLSLFSNMSRGRISDTSIGYKKNHVSLVVVVFLREGKLLDHLILQMHRFLSLESFSRICVNTLCILYSSFSASSPLEC